MFPPRDADALPVPLFAASMCRGAALTGSRPRDERRLSGAAVFPPVFSFVETCDCR
jgi:hypothetical protein